MDIFESSYAMISELKSELQGATYIDGGLRLDLVHECCSITIEHGVAIQILLENYNDISALALFRIQFEAVVRAYWLLMVATNDEVYKFNITHESELMKNVKIPSVSSIIELLKEVKEITHIVESFREFKFYSLKHLHSIVHTGRNSVIQYRAGFTEALRSTLVKQTNGFVTMSGQILLRHCGKEKYIHYLHNKYRACFQMQEDISEVEKQRIDAKYKKYV